MKRIKHRGGLQFPGSRGSNTVFSHLNLTGNAIKNDCACTIGWALSVNDVLAFRFLVLRTGGKRNSKIGTVLPAKNFITHGCGY
jgi:hypothetical protein